MSDTPTDPLDEEMYKNLSPQEFQRLLDRAMQITHGAESLRVIQDVGAMMGQCAQMGKGRKTIADINGRYQPKTDLGKHIQATVDREMARIRAERQARVDVSVSSEASE